MYMMTSECCKLMVVKKDPRSPLRYAGGKSRGVVEILEFISEKTRTICSPFFGGGSIELACANNGISVRGYDNFRPLVEFWQCLLRDPRKLAQIVAEYYPLAKSKFYELQKIQHEYKSKYQRAAVFFVLNRTSFSGTTLSGGMSPNHPRFTPSSIGRIRDFRVANLFVEQANFVESIKKSRNILLYLDPPYALNQRLYGNHGNMHSGFDHEKLAEMLHRRDNWILSYNDCEKVHNLYDGYYFYYPQWKYGMSNNKNSREVLILSHDIAEAM